MKRDTLIDAVRNEPLFTPGMLLTPGADAQDVRRQLSRWKNDGTVLQLRRGLYALGDRYRSADPHPYEVSNALVPASYVSLETVLAARGLIPEAVFATTAVTTGRQGIRQTPFGRYVYHHIKRELFWGYETLQLDGPRTAHVATVEKALLDMAYLRSHSDEPGFVRELRLQNLDVVDRMRLQEYAERFGSRKVERFCSRVLVLADEQLEEWDR